MAKPKRRRKKPKKKSTFWQWILVALAALILYKGLDYLLTRQTDGPKRIRTAGEQKNIKPSSPLLSPGPEASLGPIEKWTFEKAARFLPQDGFEDNYETIALHKNGQALLAYAKVIAGKKPGPQGLTNTRPGLLFLDWDGKKYQSVELPFKDLAPALGGLSPQNLMGLPQVEKKPMSVKGANIFPAKIFLNKDDRVVLAFLLVDEQGPRWPQLHHASGKKMPAAFVQGTTKKTTRNVKTQTRDGNFYIIVENGLLDEFKAYAGYRWNVQTYYWDGSQFVYDREYSQELTKQKKLSVK